MTLLRIPRIPLPIALFLALLLPLASGPALAAPGPRPYTHVDLVLAKDLMLAQLNAVRQEKGLPMLVEDPSVSAVALAHARDMVARDYFAHVSPEGATPQERLAAAGLPYPVGENLGALRSYGLTTGEIARGLLQSLLDSPPHRANLLDRRATHIGLGFCQDKDSQTNFMDLSMEGTGAGTVVVCQEFVRKPLKAWTPPMA
ncbi:MAG TPA: CAP domain-containing protein, partial [bacterium]|nr:CAP domain-containing protein [bacterium]